MPSVLCHIEKRENYMVGNRNATYSDEIKRGIYHRNHICILFL